MKERTVMKYVAATLSIAIAIGPASALDVGLDGKAGGIGVGAGVGVGREVLPWEVARAPTGLVEQTLEDRPARATEHRAQASGLGGDIDGVGGADLGGSVGTGNAAPSAGDGGSPGAAPARSAGGPTAGSAGGSSAGSATISSGASSHRQRQGTRNTKVALPNALMPIILLPRSLGPSGRDTSARGTWGYPRLPKIARKPGTSNAVVRVCQQAIFSAAKPLGAVGVQAASAGPVSRQRNGLTAPLSVQIDYGKEVRQATVGCRLDAKGKVIGVT